VIVEGGAEGSLFGDEQIIIRKSGQVRGDVVAPRVTLEDGATFKGSIEMEVTPQPTLNARPNDGSTAPVTASTVRSTQPESSGKALPPNEPKAAEKKA
jgi:cytoskeletal protein CcmA (bactofilin family)